MDRFLLTRRWKAHTCRRKSGYSQLPRRSNTSYMTDKRCMNDLTTFLPRISNLNRIKLLVCLSSTFHSAATSYYNLTVTKGLFECKAKLI
jgi:hypothetical protein